MSSFEKILLRLKERLGVQTDKEVAEALGLSIKAFTARKMRGSFPKDKLITLKVSRPDLGLDIDYVLLGANGGQNVYEQAVKALDSLPSPTEEQLLNAQKKNEFIDEISRRLSAIKSSSELTNSIQPRGKRMQPDELNDVHKSRALNRYEQADAIIADYERQHDFKLPVPWRFAVSKLLLNGLSDPELHLIFDTLMRVEYEAGRLDERAIDYSKLAEEK